MPKRTCSLCGMEFDEDKLKLTCEGFGCPYCGSLNCCESPPTIKKFYKWEEANVKYKEGHHD